MKKKLVLSICISGGIDSSSIIYLLKENDFYIEFFFMKNWENKKLNFCKYNIDLFHILFFTKIFKINLNVINYSKIYWDKIFVNLLKELNKGKTPNSDIICNKKIKFGILVLYIIKKLNYSKIVSGHYSKIKNIKNKNYLFKSFDKIKDQSYFLSSINRKILKNIFFPLSSYKKKFIKNLVNKLKYVNSNKKESMGICFIENKKYKNFISLFIKKNTGSIIYNKLIVGQHEGLFFYTIGERKNIKNNNKNFYITNKNINNNTLTIDSDLSSLYKKKINIVDSKLKNLNKKKIYSFKLRNTSKNFTMIIKNIKNNKFLFLFKDSQFFFTSGQYIVLYEKDCCLYGYKIQ
jgi:tRNA-uridine 2-sulfurtransferase